MRVYAIGDVHGHLDSLATAHALIATDRRRTGDMAAPVVHLGDLIDRGPESAEVIEYLRRGPAEGDNWITLRGNHDDLFAALLDGGDDAPDVRHWLNPRIGGQATLDSYGVSPGDDDSIRAELLARVPDSHRRFLSALPRSYVLPGLIFAHAGIRPGVALDAQAPRDLIWIRDEFLTSTEDHGALVVHGHTPVERVTLYPNRLNMDSGAAWGGPVSAAVIEEGRVALLTPDGRRWLQPEPPPVP